MHWHADRKCPHTIIVRGYVDGSYESRDEFQYVGVLLDCGDYCRLEGFHGPDEALRLREHRGLWAALLRRVAALGFAWLVMERHGRERAIDLQRWKS